jgi:hypothetical protein
MTIAELIDTLQKLPPEALVIQSSDAEGNRFSPTAEVGIGRYTAENAWSGEFLLMELTDEHRAQGYTEEDVGNGPIAICFWPTN